MFWKYNSPSSVQIDALLQQENVSLHDLMEEEELLQECKAQNKKLIDFLTRPEILEDLICLMVTEPPPDVQLQTRFKHANLASELLTCDIPAIIDKVASSSNLLQMLYKFLQREKPLNPLLASFVSRVFGMLVQRRSEQNWYSYQFTCFQVLDFLKSQGDFVDVAVNHIGTSAVMDLLSKLICGVDDDNLEIKRGIHEWLDDCHLIERLVEKLTPDCDSEEHSSVDQLLGEIIPKGSDSPHPGGINDPHTGNCSQSRLLKTLESENVINRLMDTLLHEDRSESSVSHVINILLNLLSYKCSNAHSSFSSANCIGVELGSIDDSQETEFTVLKTIVNRLPELQQILVRPPKRGTILTTYGSEVERLGSTRLKVVSLVTALILTRNQQTHSIMAAQQTISLLLELFFKFPLNNFLHTQVTQCITCIISQPILSAKPNNSETVKMDGLNNNPMPIENGGQDVGDDANAKKEDIIKDITEWKEESLPPLSLAPQPLLVPLISEACILQKILQYYDNEANSTEKQLHNLIGYGGHIREIANTLVQSSTEGICAQLIQAEIQKLPNVVLTHWEEFTQKTLEEVNLKNKVIPLQVSQHLHRVSDDDSDEEFSSCDSRSLAMNQGFKEEMESLGEFRFVDDFKDVDGEDIPNGQHNIFSQLGTGSEAGAEGEDITLEENRVPNYEMFEEMCSHKSSSGIFESDDWHDREKQIDFDSKLSCDDDKDVDVVDDEAHSSSDEDEIVEHLDDEFDTLRNNDEKMDVDFASEWTDVFDKRCSILNEKLDFNPWQSAPAEDTSGVNSWADFGAVSSGVSFAAFPPQTEAQATSKCSPEDPMFEVDFSTRSFSVDSEPSGRNVSFEADFGAHCSPQNQSGSNSLVNIQISSKETSTSPSTEKLNIDNNTLEDPRISSAVLENSEQTSCVQEEEIKVEPKTNENEEKELNKAVKEDESRAEKISVILPSETHEFTSKDHKLLSSTNVTPEEGSSVPTASATAAEMNEVSEITELEKVNEVNMEMHERALPKNDIHANQLSNAMITAGVELPLFGVQISPDSDQKTPPHHPVLEENCA